MGKMNWNRPANRYAGKRMDYQDTGVGFASRLELQAVMKENQAKSLVWEPDRYISYATINAHKTGRGGWTKSTLAKWGVPWPPPANWQYRLAHFDPTLF
jgi:hypothetical protein